MPVLTPTTVTVRSAVLRGIEAVPVDVVVTVAPSTPSSYRVDGLAPHTVREGAVRIRSALESIGVLLPGQAISVVLRTGHPGPMSGAPLDLPIAVALLVAVGKLPPTAADVMYAGELALDGRVRKIRGALAVAEVAAHERRTLVCPADNVDVAAMAAGAGTVQGIDALSALVAGHDWIRARPGGRSGFREQARDMRDVRGMPRARRALEIAAAGGHSLLLVGPPGIGKSMLARRAPTILPDLDPDESREVTRVYSALGLADAPITERPFRSPHHTVSAEALTGGGANPRPGEVSLAHHGILFLDEIPEFQRSALEALRGVIRDRHVIVGRSTAPVRFPAAFALIAAANPCPCGWAGTQLRACVCGPSAVERYRARLARTGLTFDLTVGIDSMTIADLRGAPDGESSAAIRERVTRARRDHLDAWQEPRADHFGAPVDPVYRVGQTIAALAGRADVTEADFAEARSFATPIGGAA